MKLRNVVIVLLAIFMVFAFASCSNEPKNNPQPGPTGVNQTYRLTATKSRVDKWYTDDKFALDFTLLDGFSVKENDVISFSYRSTMEFEEYSIRHGDYCWVYEDSKEALTTYEVGEDGWIKVSYKFGPKCFLKDNHVPRSEWELEPVPYPETFRFDLRGYVFAGDILEIKDLALNGNYLTLTQNLIASDYCAPTLVVVDENTPAFPGARDFAVIYGEGSLSNSNAPLSYELVEEGGKVAHVPTRDHYTISLYTTSDATKQNEETLFNPAEATITKDTVLYIVAVPETYKVTYVYNNGSENTVVDAEYGSLLTAPADPEKQGQVFAGWFKDDKLTVPFDFAEELISEDTPIYAAWGDPVAITFDAENGAEDEVTVVNAAKGYPVAPLADPTFGSKLFLGWFLDGAETAYDFSTPVSEAITLYAHWVNATDVTLNLNYTGATTTSFKAMLDVALSKDDENLEVKIIRPGLVFAGWYDDADCKTAHDFSAIVTESFTLYAKWEDGTIYHVVATKGDGSSDYDKFILDWQGGSNKVNKDDTIAFAYRSTVEFSLFNVRDNETTIDSQKDKWVYETGSNTLTSYEVGADGWTYVSYKFAEKFAGGGTVSYPAVFRFDLISKNIRPGDILEIKGITINGAEVVLPKVDVCATEFTIVEKNYEWTDRTVTFSTDGGTAIPAATVKHGFAVEKPADPTKEGGVLFAGWYADAEFSKEFNFSTRITEDTVIYAKWAEPVTVSFAGADIENIVIPSGGKIDKPNDPSKAENAFGGWYADDQYSQEFDFTAAITKNTTVYVKWIPAWAVTVNLNNGTTPYTETVYVVKGAAMSKPENPIIAGLYFDGWFTEATGGTEVDFTAEVSSDKTIYAHWTEPETYIKLTSTYEAKRFTVRYSDSVISPEKGDVIAFKYRPHGGTFKYVNIRNANSSDSTAFAKDTKIIDAGYSSATADDDGWFTFYFVFPENYKNGTPAVYPYSGIIMEMIDSSMWQVGDSLDILGFSYNGVELTISATDNTKGLYDNGSYAKPTLNEYYVANDTLVVVPE